MRKLVLAAGALALAGAAFAGEDSELVIDGQTLVIRAPAPDWHPLDEVTSGWIYRSDETQALELDDFENPGFAVIPQAETLWETAEGSAGQSCADCHGDVSSMAGLRAVMPKWSEALGRPLTLEQWINWSRTTHMGAEEWKWESPEMVAMTALIGLQSRGMPVAPQIDGPMAEWWERGREIYYTRVGQLDMACSSCHESNEGNMLRADHLSQGQINGFPTYRLKWGEIGSTHRRFKGCMEDVRAEPYKVGSDEFVALELYVASRGTGLSVETPAVRH